MSISFDAKANAQNATATDGVNPVVTTWSHTVTSTADFLTVIAIWSASGAAAFTVSFNGIAMTAGFSDANVGIGKKCFYLPNPTVGTHTVSVSVTGALNAASSFGFISASYIGVDTGNLGSQNTVTSDASASASVTAISNNSWVFGCISRGSSLAPTITTGTQREEITVTSLGEGFAFVDNSSFSAGSSGTIASSNGRNACAMSLSAATTAVAGGAFLLNFV